MPRAVYTIPVNLPREIIWNTIRDLTLAPRFVPGVRRVQFLTGHKTGQGASRRVLPSGLDETVILWEEQLRFVLKLHKKNRERFFPFRRATFEYFLNRNAPEVTLCLAYTPSIPLFLVRKAIQRRVEKIGMNLKRFCEGLRTEDAGSGI